MRVTLYQLPDTGYAHLDRDWKTNDELPTHGETADGNGWTNGCAQTSRMNRIRHVYAITSSFNA